MPPPLDSSQRFHKPIRLPKQHYLGRRAYFLTLCARDRAPYFRSRRIALWVLESLQQITAQQSFTLRAYSPMPDHLHLLLQVNSPSSNLFPFLKTSNNNTPTHSL